MGKGGSDWHWCLTRASAHRSLEPPDIDHVHVFRDTTSLREAYLKQCSRFSQIKAYKQMGSKPVMHDLRENTDLQGTEGSKSAQERPCMASRSMLIGAAAPSFYGYRDPLAHVKVAHLQHPAPGSHSA